MYYVGSNGEGHEIREGELCTVSAVTVRDVGWGMWVMY